jgi:hypothetical protein
MTTSLEQEFIQIIKNQDWLMHALKEAHDLGLPDWYIAAGAIRNTIWNYLHDYPTISNQNDIDVIYFDKDDMSEKKEKISEEKLRKRVPELRWEVVNQARAHLFDRGQFKRRPAVNSPYESISYWSETPTCVGVRLNNKDNLKICAPHGLNDLMTLVVRPVPPPYRELPLYKKRINEKNWKKIWPKLKILYH